MEKIKSAAIKYRVKGESEFKYMIGTSHAECINAFAFINLYKYMRDMDVEVQGFMTSEDRFVDRIEAKDIAINVGQVPSTYDRDVLYSEFVDWNK